MKYRKLDHNGDYTLGSGEDFFVDSPDAVAQAVRTRLMLFQDEWLYDREGTPWTSEILGRVPPDAYDAALRARILGTPGVVEISSYSSAIDTNARELTVQVTIVTQYGRATMEAVL